MDITSIIKNNKYVKNRLPVDIAKLRKYVNKQTGKLNDSQTIGGIFKNKNPRFHDFEYVRVKRGIYFPAEWKTIKDVINAVARGREFIAHGLTLRNQLGATTQNSFISTYYLFGDPVDTDQNVFDAISDFVNITYISIYDPKEIYVFKMILSIKSSTEGFFNQTSMPLMRLMKSYKLNKKDLIDLYNQYRKYKGNTMVTGDLRKKLNLTAPWNLLEDENNTIEKMILEGVFLDEYNNV